MQSRIPFGASRVLVSRFNHLKMFRSLPKKARASVIRLHSCDGQMANGRAPKSVFASSSTLRALGHPLRRQLGLRYGFLVLVHLSAPYFFFCFHNQNLLGRKKNSHRPTSYVLFNDVSGRSIYVQSPFGKLHNFYLKVLSQLDVDSSVI